MTNQIHPPAPPFRRPRSHQVLPSNYSSLKLREGSDAAAVDYRRPFTVVFSYCQHDRNQMLATLKWMQLLDKSVPFKAVMAHNLQVPDPEVTEAAGKLFQSVQELVLPPNPHDSEPWPIPQNWQFQRIAEWIAAHRQNRSWIFLEPDVVPLKSEWLTTLFTEYSRSKIPFMGHVHDLDPHMNGSGVYPANLIDYAPSCFSATSIAWDAFSAHEIVHQCHKANHLMQLVWTENGNPISFKSHDHIRNVISLSAVTFTRLKDTSLMDAVDWNPQELRLVLSGTAMAKPKKPKRGVVLLASYGDIINAIPIAYHLYETDLERPSFIASSKFVDLLSGCSYLIPVGFNGSPTNIVGAWSEYVKKYEHLHVAQVYCNDGYKPKLEAYNLDSWDCAGFAGHFGKYPLQFDARNHAREAELAKRLDIDGGEPVVLTSFSGLSSPYPFTDQLMNGLTDAMSGKAKIVDISKVRAEKLYDLLGLMNRSAALLTIDTSTLHLAAASNVPIVGLISDCNSMWHGSVPARACEFQIRYQKSARKFKKIVEVIDGLVERWSKRSSPRKLHVVQRYDHHNAEAARRFRFAEQTWLHMYAKFGWEPIMVRETGRDCSHIDPRFHIPFLKDVWKVGLDQCDDHDLVIYTNDDTVLKPEIDDMINVWISKRDAFCGFRNNFKTPIQDVGTLNLANTEISYGRDIFVFRASWLRKHWHLIPDALPCCSEWDYYMAVLFRHLAGCELSMEDMHWSNPLAEIPRGHVFHEDHTGTRHAEANRFAKIEEYSIGECHRMMQQLGIKGMHLS